MHNPITHRTVLPGRLFLCPETAVHHARPPPVSVQIINPLLASGENNHSGSIENNQF